MADITNLSTTSTPNAKINEDKNEIPSITNLATTAAIYAKKNEVKNKISSITNLATTDAFTAVRKKIPDHNKYITTLEFYKLTKEIFFCKISTSKFSKQKSYC